MKKSLNFVFNIVFINDVQQGIEIVPLNMFLMDLNSISFQFKKIQKFIVGSFFINCELRCIALKPWYSLSHFDRELSLKLLESSRNICDSINHTALDNDEEQNERNYPLRNRKVCPTTFSRMIWKVTKNLNFQIIYFEPLHLVYWRISVVFLN